MQEKVRCEALVKSSSMVADPPNGLERVKTIPVPTQIRRIDPGIIARWLRRPFTNIHQTIRVRRVFCVFPPTGQNKSDAPNGAPD